MSERFGPKGHKHTLGPMHVPDWHSLVHAAMWPKAAVRAQ
jgi:hypothetical protein